LALMRSDVETKAVVADAAHERPHVRGA
jgi:hypothetical protein